MADQFFWNCKIYDNYCYYKISYSVQTTNTHSLLCLRAYVTYVNKTLHAQKSIFVQKGSVNLTFLYLEVFAIQSLLLSVACTSRPMLFLIWHLCGILLAPHAKPRHYSYTLSCKYRDAKHPYIYFYFKTFFYQATFALSWNNVAPIRQERDVCPSSKLYTVELTAAAFARHCINYSHRNNNFQKFDTKL